MNIKKFESYEKDVETVQAKIRNKLSPYWNLVSMIEVFDILPEDKKEKIWNSIKEQSKLIKSEKDNLLDLIKQTEI